MAEIPKIVGQRLRAIAEVGEHPDSNLLSAFVERGLGKRERVQVLEHLSQCTSCREIASLSATEVADAAPVVVASPGWTSWPVVRWGAVAACLVVVSAVVTLHHKREPRQMAASIAEVKPATEMLPGPNSAIGKKSASLPLPASNSEAKAGFASKNIASQQKAGPANLEAGNNAAAAPGPVEMADARPSLSQPLSQPEVPGRAKDAFMESQVAQADRTTGGAMAKKRSMLASEVSSDALLPPALIPRWTLSSDGTLQRSLDSGRTWETIPVSNQTTFRALAANGLDIWVGGSGGALFHSSDAGQRWTQVRPVANGEALTDDIIGVEFTDTLHGKLTTSDDESWATADAGQTWQKP